MLKRYLMEMPPLRWARRLALFVLLPMLGQAAPFTPGNVVVVRVGDGSAGLTSAATAVVLLEYTPAGVLVQSIPLPTAVSGTNRILTVAGSSTTDAGLTRSADGAYLVITGYDAAPGVAAVAGTAPATTNRIVGRVAADGSIDTSTRLTDATGNLRAGTTVNGTSFYTAGSSGGVRYVPFGNNGTSTVISSTPSNLRYVNTFGGNLYVSSGSSPFIGVSQVGSGLPTTSGQTTVLLPGFPANSAVSPLAFYFADLNPSVPGVDVVYVADDGNTAAGGGIQKFSLVGSTWTYNGTITGGSGSSIRGLDGQVGATGVVTLVASGSGLFFLNDNSGYNNAPSTATLPAAIATAGTNYSFRGAAFANAVPVITNIAPASGQTGTPVTITGTNFTGVKAVTLNGAAITGYTVVNASTITFNVPTGATSGTITVTTPLGTATSPGTFTVLPDNPAPTISSLSPSSVTAGAAAQTLTVNGTNFIASSVVNFNNTARTTTYVSATQLTIQLTAGDQATAGSYNVTVTNPTPGGGTSAAATFTVSPAALPNLVVSTGTATAPTPITGNYNNVTINPNAFAVLVGPLTAAGTLTISGGGGLAQNCQLLSGTGTFDLQAGGTLAICDPAGIAPTGVPTGAVLLLGTRTYSPLANYIYNGTAAQATGLGLPTTVLAVGVANPANVTLSQGLSLTQGLQLQNGNLITNSQPFTLLSSATGTAGVVNVGGVVVGTATVQRYINSSNSLGYRHYSAPVSNTTFADLNAPGFTPVFNPSYNSSATPGTVRPFPTVFGYNQDRIATVTSNASAFDKGWFSPAGSSDPMAVGKGYTVNAPNTALIDFVGTLNNGPVASGTLNRGTDAAAGWHLLGNPYPSPLDWSTVTPAQRPGMDAAIYVFESAGQYGGTYRASVNGVGGNANSPQPIVVSSQGYFVRVASGQASGQVNLDNPNRVTTFGAQPSFGRGTADTRPQVALTLQGASVADAAYVYFQAGATAGKDVEFDATKLPNSHGLNLTSLAGGEALAINGLPVLGTATVLVPLNVAAPQAGSYSLTADALANLAGTTVTLIDALSGTRTVLNVNSTYAFSLSSTTATGRFALEFRPAGALATTPAQALAAQVQLFPNPASSSFRVQLPVLGSKAVVAATLTNALGQTVLSRSLSAPAGQAIDAEFDVHALATGVYTLRLTVDGTLLVRKVVVE
ncbi:T9SS type A sorting domain-containing protein [Hymenobacter negativus]|uniref:T9SS type A sorting domain-containing protein n=1 Tax=Hymenobacter negativus TaxID=2795026 RepID=A0ABS0Q525_9BACT|nr:T9SS type A sorting domain-containing protein [Hymenobacter negativus]MBH8557764.1 T9SS type A sorting domain-containing protein [Hymenobacter negativus]